MPASNYPNGFESGLVVRNVPILNSYTGNVYWVDSGAGSDYGKGTYLHPFATTDYAIGRCTANNGDLILVKSGHAETLATASAITADVAGISIIGVGTGADRPTLTFSDTAATMVISAASVTFQNFIVKPSVDSVVSPIVVSGADCWLDYEHQDASAAVEAVRAILTTAGADRLHVDLNYIGFIAGNACVNAVRLVGVDTADINVDFYGVASTSIVEFHTTACHNITVTGTHYNSGTTDFSKNVVDTVTGSTWSVKAFDAAAAAGYSGGSGSAIAGDDVSAVAAAVAVVDGYHDVPTADAATNTVMRDVVGNKTDAAAAGAVSTTESLMAYAKQNVTLAIARDTAIGIIDGYHDVPTADVATNTQMRDVVGNKTDAAATGAVSTTESLMAYAKQTVTEGIARDAAIGVIDGFHDVPTADAATNAQMRDVLGNKTDTNAGNSVYSYHLVQTADAVTNTTMRDVVGNKTDAAATGAVSTTESLMAYAKQTITEGIARDAAIGVIDGYHDVPTADAAANAQMRDVIGNKTDTNAGNSVYSYHLVQTADAVTNATMRDVVGNKTDAAVYSPGTTKSLLAHLKGVSDLQEKVAVATAAVMVNGNTIFTVAGGPIRVLGLWSECVTGNDATASTLQYNATPTAGGAQTLSGASGSLANATAGASVSLIGGTLATAALYNANGPNLGMSTGGGDIIVPAGVIDIVIGVGSTTGTWRHYLRYAPLSTGVTVS